jgi:hypothetical protein
LIKVMMIDIRYCYLHSFDLLMGGMLWELWLLTSACLWTVDTDRRDSRDREDI